MFVCLYEVAIVTRLDRTPAGRSSETVARTDRSCRLRVRFQSGGLPACAFQSAYSERDRDNPSPAAAPPWRWCGVFPFAVRRSVNRAGALPTTHRCQKRNFLKPSMSSIGEALPHSSRMALPAFCAGSSGDRCVSGEPPALTEATWLILPVAYACLKD